MPHMNGGRSFKYNSADTNMAVLEQMYVRILSEMCINRFKWIGLPPHINERFLERTLLQTALVVFYWDEDYDRFLALRGSGIGPLNMYDEPTAFRVVGNSTFVGKDLTIEQCVPVWANTMRVPDWDIVITYAARLASIDRTIDINAKNARRTKIVVADESQRQSAININNQIDTGQAAIFLNTHGLDLVNNFTALDLGVHPDSIEKLQIARGRLWNECMGLLGLNFANQDKRERMVVDEVSANDEQVGNMRAVALNERKRACRAINEKWGLNIDVKFHVDLPRPIENTGGEL